LNAISKVGVSSLLAARDDLTFVEKTSNTNVSLSKLRKAVIIGAGPPDRGGRPKDVLHMPQWKERIVTGGGGPERERRGGKKKGGKKPWKEDGAGAGPSGSVSMKKRSQRKSKRSSSDAD